MLETLIAAAVVAAGWLGAGAEASVESPAAGRAGAQQQPPQEEPARPLPLRRLVGERLWVRFQGRTPSKAFLTRVRRGEVGGVVLFGDNTTTIGGVERIVRRLDAAAAKGGLPAPFVAIDQEGGIVKRLPAEPPKRSAPQLGQRNSTAAARSDGRATGRSLSAAGVDVNFAPVADVPASANAFITSRSFGQDPRRVRRLADAFAVGLQDGGVHATLKHFPGLGSAPANTDFDQATVNAPAARLERELLPYRGTHARLVMLATAVYPAYHRGVPAAFSRRIVTTLLRENVGFGGVVVTDDLETPAVRAYTSVSEGAVKTLRAGADVALVVRSEAGGSRAFAHMLDAARDGRLTRAQLEASHARVNALRSPP